MNIDWQEVRQYAFFDMSKKREITEDTILKNRVLNLGAKVDIYANVVCEHCKIQIRPQAQIWIGENASLKLRNCVVKVTESGEVWRSKDKYGALVQNDGVVEMKDCRVKDLTIDSTEQWAVYSTGSVKIENIDFCNCVGNFFRCGSNFRGESLKTENFAGQFFDSLNNIWDWVNSEDEGELENDIDGFKEEGNEDSDCVVFDHCDFRFAPRKKYIQYSMNPWIPAPPFIKLIKGFVVNCEFTAQGDYTKWDQSCISLKQSTIDNCTFKDCVNILTEHADFKDCAFVNSTQCQA